MQSFINQKTLQNGPERFAQRNKLLLEASQLTFTCSKLTIETLEQGLKLTIKTSERR